jgi:hypothetical protein
MSKRRDITDMVIELGLEMKRQRIGGYKCGPTMRDHLFVKVEVWDASPREVERHRCKKRHVRGGHTFRCERMGLHPAMLCLIKTKTGGYQTVQPLAKRSKT